MSLPERWVEPALLADALALAGAYAFDMGEDGQLDFADTAALETRFGITDTSAAAWRERIRKVAHRKRADALESLKQPGDRYDIRYRIGDTRVREVAEAKACADGRATLVRGVLIDDERPEDLDAIGTQLADIGDRIGIPVHLIRLRLSNLDVLTEAFGPELRRQLLDAAYKRLKGALRSPDQVVPLGGVDFAAVTLNSDPDTLGLRLRAALTAELYDTPHGELALEQTQARAPLGSVEAALETTRRFLSGESAPTRKPDPNVPDVKTALSENRLSLAFQPIVHAGSRKLHHFEVLLRLRDSEGRIGGAFPFIVEAEAQGEVHRIDAYVLDAVRPLLEADESLQLAVNVSAGTIGHDGYAHDYVEALRAMGPLATRLTLEMTETLAVDDPGQAERFAQAAHALGCRFAVDDFASGHTSFGTLLAVDADCIKIDGSLVRGVALDDNKQAFMRMMVDLARTVKVETVAEMVEDRADAEVLTRLGVDYLQGYYFGRPGPEPLYNPVAD